MESEITKQKRPKWVWVISILYLVSACFTLLSFYLIYSGAISLPPDQSQYFAKLTKLDHGLSILVGFLNLFAAISLFRLKKTALYLFTVSYSLGILITAWHIASKGWVQAIGGSSGIGGAILGWCLIVAVYTYTLKLYKTKVLS